jgi:hypothetical protein
MGPGIAAQRIQHWTETRLIHPAAAGPQRQNTKQKASTSASSELSYETGFVFFFAFFAFFCGYYCLKVDSSRPLRSSVELSVFIRVHPFCGSFFVLFAPFRGYSIHPLSSAVKLTERILHANAAKILSVVKVLRINNTAASRFSRFHDSGIPVRDAESFLGSQRRVHHF